MSSAKDPQEFNVETLQATFCKERGLPYEPAMFESILGFALSTDGKIPINGLRHRGEGDTNGWYIWCGEEFSEAPDFFSPLHTRHVYENHPELTKLLGLAPGYRFLVAGEYVDIWFDPALLAI